MLNKLVLLSIFSFGLCLLHMSIESASVAVESGPIVVKSKTIARSKPLSEEQIAALSAIDRTSFIALNTKVLAHIADTARPAKGRFDICQFCQSNDHADTNGLIRQWATEVQLDEKHLEGLCLCNIFFYPDTSTIDWTVFLQHAEIPEDRSAKQLEKLAIEKLLTNLHYTRNLARYGLESMRKEILKLINICQQTEHKQFIPAIKTWAQSNKKVYRADWCLCSMLLSQSQRLNLSASFNPGVLGQKKCCEGCCDRCCPCCTTCCSGCSCGDMCVIL